MTEISKPRRFFTAAGVFAVAAVAAAISYRHQQHLSATHGQPMALALVWPLCVDGLVASCGIAIAADRAGGYLPRVWALVGFWLGVAVSILTNWLATTGGLVNHGISAFPAVAFLISMESLTGRPRVRRALAVVPVPVAEPSHEAAPVPTPALDAPEPTPATEETLAPAQDTMPVSKADRMRAMYAEALAAGRRLSHADLAEATGSDLSHARRIHRTLVRDTAEAVA